MTIPPKGIRPLAVYFLILGEASAIFAPRAVPANLPITLNITKKIRSRKASGATLKSRCIPLKVKNIRNISSSEYLSSIRKIFSGSALKFPTIFSII